MSLQDFKAIESVDMDMAPLTVLIGPNNAGKSSLLHALALVAQSAGAVLQTRGQLVDLGPEVGGVINSGRQPSARTASLGLTWSLDADGGPAIVESLGFAMDVHRDGHFDNRFSAEVTLPYYGLIRFEASPGTGNFTAVGMPHATAAGARPAFQIDVPPSSMSPWHIATNWQPPFQESAADRRPIDPAGIASEALVHVAPFFANSVHLLRGYRYVSASRHVDSSIFSLGPRRSANPRTAQELFDTLAYDDDLLERVSTRCKSVFGYGLTKGLVEPNQVTLSAMGPTDRQNIVNMGSGLVQMVWVLTQLELTRKADQLDDGPWQWCLVGVEEPELHLHPRLQPDMARILVNFAQDGVAVLCTTQSEHLLLSLLTLVLEGELAPGAIVVYYVEKGRVERLSVDQRGRIAGGLRGFFEANEAQLKRHIELLRERA